MIERIFRILARRYHPDNTETGNADRFRMLREAYQVLSDPDHRAAYDVRYQQCRERQLKIYEEASSASGSVDEDNRMRQGVLALLYIARRRDVTDAGIGVLELESMLGCPEKHLEFHTWYLKEKGWIQRLESGQFAITATGVDHVGTVTPFLREDRMLAAAQAPPAGDGAQSPR